MIAKIVGVTSYKKDEEINYTLHFIQDFSEYDRTNGAEGLKVSTVWTKMEKAASIGPDDLVDLQFEPGFQGKAALIDILRYQTGFEHPLNAISVKSVFNFKPSASASETSTAVKGGK